MIVQSAADGAATTSLAPLLRSRATKPGVSSAMACVTTDRRSSVAVNNRPPALAMIDTASSVNNTATGPRSLGHKATITGGAEKPSTIRTEVARLRSIDPAPFVQSSIAQRR